MGSHGILATAPLPHLLSSVYKIEAPMESHGQWHSRSREMPGENVWKPLPYSVMHWKNLFALFWIRGSIQILTGIFCLTKAIVPADMSPPEIFPLSAWTTLPIHAEITSCKKPEILMF